MKRPTTDEASNETKRAKLDPFDASLFRRITDLSDAGSDGSGYIAGTVFMIWPVSRKMQFNFETVEQKKRYRFDINFSGACSRYFDKLEVHPQDVLQIALRGVNIIKKQRSSAPNCFPVTLEYTQGVCVKFVKRARKPTENGLVVDTWLCKY
jgi:hypothetical protein